MPSVPLVRTSRSGLEESVHRGDVAVVDTAGQLVAWAGEPDRTVYARSCMKPFQAAVSLSLAPFDFDQREVAVMCASHNAEPVHLAAVRSLMARAGVAEEALRCQAMRPWDEEALAADPVKRRINSDCSGKHGGMLAACVAQGWPTETYRDLDHPLQRAVLSGVLAGSGLPSVYLGVDGCGVPVHGMPLHRMAAIYARLTDRAELGELAGPAGRAVGAMTDQPYLVAGRNRVDTAVMEAAHGLVVKSGAESLICAASLERHVGVALKIRDGSGRASGVALIHALRLLGLLDDEAAERLAPFARPAVLGGGKRVGELTPGFALSEG